LKPILPLAVLAVLLAGCQQQKQAEFKTALDVKEIMAHVVDPGSFMVWTNSGYVIDETGEHDRYPTTEEGWKVMEDGAVIVAEAGNLLKLGNRPREPVAEWNKFADLLTQRAMETKAAVESKDKTAIFDTGGRLYEVCTGCHAKFIIEPQQAAEAAAAKK
jgi:hypothetical protein